MAPSSDCGDEGTVMTSEITHYAPQLWLEKPQYESRTFSWCVCPALGAESQRHCLAQGEWGLMSICLTVIISPTSSRPDSHKQIHTSAAVIQAAVSQRALPVSQASNPLLICMPLLERMISLFSVVSFTPVHPLIQNRAICHAYHPSQHSHHAFFSPSLYLSLCLSQILALQTSFSQESLWLRGAAAHHTPPLKCSRDSNTKDHSWTSG